jgi:hypothetical protein
MDEKETNAALMEIYSPREKPSFKYEEMGGDILVGLCCWLCLAEVEFKKSDGVPSGWKIVNMQIPQHSDFYAPFCPGCFPRAQALYKGMKEVGLL